MYEEITIKQFEEGFFKKNYEIFTEEQIFEAYTEYIDTAGLYETEEFQKITYIYYLDNRLNSVKLSVKLQKEFIEDFGIPYIPDIQFLKKFGHRVIWDESKGVENFISQLDKCIQRDSKYESTLKSKIKELSELKEKKNTKKSTLSQSRSSWIKTINSLGKIGYHIIKTETTLEELSWMIKQQTDESKK